MCESSCFVDATGYGQSRLFYKPGKTKTAPHQGAAELLLVFSNTSKTSTPEGQQQ